MAAIYAPLNHWNAILLNVSIMKQRCEIKEYKNWDVEAFGETAQVQQM